uniref:PolyA_pol domain-containing protein n=1 Tax=Syphacia muris TaxID=451379 RepID=A0A0N5AFK8_9BILA
MRNLLFSYFRATSLSLKIWIRRYSNLKPFTMKIDTPLFHSLFTPEMLKLNKMFKDNHFQLRMAGGAVRDLLMDIKPADIDFATDATPAQMKEMFEKNSVRMFNKNGEGHGTVSCRIDDKENFEITTLRIDVICDGRRAKVEFTTDWEKDANRRDLTINSLFLDFDGTIIDYFGGVDDIRKRRVVFVGDPVVRIQSLLFIRYLKEDFLRILRYFRFFGRISAPGSVHDESCIKAIINNKNGLAWISGERIWLELKKICVGKLAVEVLQVMLNDCKLGTYLGLPETVSLDHYEKIFKFYSSQRLLPMTLLSSLFTSTSDLATFHKRCKLSNVELSLSKFILEMRDKLPTNENLLPFLKEMMVDLCCAPDRDKKKLSGNILVVELAKYHLLSKDLIEKLENWELPTFPVSGVDLIKCSVEKGPFMRQILIHLYKIWKSSSYKANKEELLKHIDEIKFDSSSAPRREGKRKRPLES